MTPARENRKTLTAIIACICKCLDAYSFRAQLRGERNSGQSFVSSSTAVDFSASALSSSAKHLAAASRCLTRRVNPGQSLESSMSRSKSSGVGAGAETGISSSDAFSRCASGAPFDSLRDSADSARSRLRCRMNESSSRRMRAFFVADTTCRDFRD